jgi:Cu2+-exporting ATPase
MKTTTTDRRPERSLWPWGLAIALGAMIAGLARAARHRDRASRCARRSTRWPRAAHGARRTREARGCRPSRLFLNGLRCASCVNRVEREPRAAPGRGGGVVSYTSHRAWMRFDRATSPAALAARVEALGFAATPYDPAALERPAAEQSRAALVRLLVAAFLAMNVMWLAIALYLGALEGMEPEVRRALRWVVIALSVPAASWCAAPFWRGAWKGLRRRELTLDLPVVLGVSTAFAANVVGTVAEAPELYVDSAAVIVFLVLLGRTLEQRARGRASAAVDSLAALAPETARRRTAHGVEVVPLASCGRATAWCPRASVPADGRLLEGEAELDESPFTGEARPALRRAGETLCGGARNLLAEIELELVARPSEGTLGRMVALLERAQTEKPRIQRRVDRVAAVFAPVLPRSPRPPRRPPASAPPARRRLPRPRCCWRLPCALRTPPVMIIGRPRGDARHPRSAGGAEAAARKRAVLDKTGTAHGRPLELRGRSWRRAWREEPFAAAAEAEGEATHPIAALRARARREAGPGRDASRPAAAW